MARGLGSRDPLGQGMSALSFEAMPSMGHATLRAFLARKRKGEVKELPALSAKVSDVCFEPARLAEFHRLCSVSDQAFIPPTALHVMVAPLHMMMLADPAFPMPLLRCAARSARVPWWLCSGRSSCPCGTIARFDWLSLHALPPRVRRPLFAFVPRRLPQA